MGGLRLLAVAALVLTGCASLSEDACRRGNWAGIGLTDGAAGRPETYVQRHAEACADVGVVPALTEWRAGRTRGLALYCTPENAYDVGRRGAPLNAVCTGTDQRLLAQANREGRLYHEISQEIRWLADENRRLEYRIDALLEGEMTAEKRGLIRAYRDDLRWNAFRAQRLALERLRYGFPPL